MEIIKVNDEKFVVLQKVDLEKFSSDENRNKFFEGKLWLRQQNSNMAFIVDRVIEASFVDIPNDPEPQKNDVSETQESTNVSENSIDSLYTGSIDPTVGQNVDIKM